MNDKKNQNIRPALYDEITAVINASKEAQAVISDDQLFLRQVSLLFNRIHVMEALFNEASPCPSETIEYLAGQAVCNECE